MNLIRELKKIYAEHGETGTLNMRVTCLDGKIIEGQYLGFTSALDNEPEIAHIDISGGEDWSYGLYENEIEKIEVI